MKNAKWLAKLGGFGYDLLIRINQMELELSERDIEISQLQKKIPTKQQILKLVRAK